MKKIMLAAALVLALAGCAQLQNAWDTLTGARVSPQAVYVERNIAIGLERTAQHYLQACHKYPTLSACSKAIEAKVVFGVRSLRKASADLNAFMKNHPDALGAKGLYDALVASANELKDIYARYNVEAVQ